jgi:hypothetical protein
MKFALILNFITLSWCSAYCVTAQSATLFAQSPDPQIAPGVSSTNRFGDPSAIHAADDFVFSANATVARIRWWGLNQVPTPFVDDFVFRLYSDATGVPGELIAETRGTVDRWPDPVISKLVVYWTTLDHPFTTQQNERYWLSIFNAGPDASWGWNNSAGGNNVSYYAQEAFGGQWQQVEGFNVDLAFELYPFPEPACAELLAAALLSISLLSLRTAGLC